MGQDSKIEWTHHTFNPWRGCEHATLEDGSPHPGCAHCYAETMSGRNPSALGRWGGASEGGVRVMGTAAYWRQPLKWNREAAAAGERRRVFCASLADVFEDWDGPIRNATGHVVKFDGHEFYSNTLLVGRDLATMDDLRRELFALIDATPHLDWLLLTKRPQNIRRMWPDAPCYFCNSSPCERLYECSRCTAVSYRQQFPKGFRDNVWLLTSVSDQATADALIPELLKCRDLVPVLGISAEPLVGPLDLMSWIGFLPLPPYTREYLYQRTSLPYLDWVIVGGESGHGARPMHPDWARSIRDQCAAANVAFHFKQWGEWAPWVNEDHYTHGGAEKQPHAWIDSATGTCGLCWLHDDDGTWSNWTGDPATDAEGACADTIAIMGKHGKKAAGRLLDGVLHDGYPPTSAS